jgi:predicted small secreted protein
MLKKILLTALLAVLLFGLVGCQTIEGMGKDIEWVGDQLGNAAE